MSTLEKKSVPILHLGRRGCREREKHLLFTGIVGLIVFTVMSCATAKAASILQTTKNSDTGAPMNQTEIEHDSPTGRWDGSFEYQSQKIKMAVDFSTDTISIPQQGLQNYPIEEISREVPEISFKVALGETVLFTGQRIGQTIQGVFQQSGAQGTFQLTYAGESPPPSTASTDEGSSDSPEEVRPVEREEVNLQTGTGVLYGTLTLPDRAGPVPLVLIIAGSGPTDRDGNSRLLPGKNNSLKMLAEGLASWGIAAVRYDKRGIAASAAAGTDESSVTFDTFIDDAASWIEKFKQDARFSDLGIIGHSEGSLIGMIASYRTGARAFVSISGSGKPIYDTLLDQLKRQMPGIVEEADQIINALRAGKRIEQVSPELQSLFRPSIQPFLISMFGYDPATEIGRLKIPVLIVNGSRDLQTDTSQAKRLAAARPEATLCIIDGMNHVLKDAPPDREGNLATYSDPKLPLADGLLECVGSFLDSNLQ
jgi:pimeloyl-ACP methyl ester carboxylesterase